jgi:hypothetical protein
MASNRLLDKDMVFDRKLQVYQNQKKDDRIKDNLVGEGGRVTPLELSQFWGHEISLDDDVSW